MGIGRSLGKRSAKQAPVSYGYNDYGIGIGRPLGLQRGRGLGYDGNFSGYGGFNGIGGYGIENDYGLSNGSGGYGIGIGRRSYDVDYDSKLGRGYGSGYSQYGGIGAHSYNFAKDW